MSEFRVPRVPVAPQAQPDAATDTGPAFELGFLCDHCGLEIAGIEDIDALPPPVVISSQEKQCDGKSCRLLMAALVAEH